MASDPQLAQIRLLRLFVLVVLARALVVHARERHRHGVSVLALQRPELDVIVSGTASTAGMMAEVLKATGVPADKVRIEDKSMSTAQSAELLRPYVGATPFFLVTSAGHLRRSMAAMHKQGLAPVAVPTDHKLPRDWTVAEFQPRPDTLGVADLAVHEYLGLLWYRLRDRA
jgi:uncharacterized SAM-binding protein YcdF (DUF218 family)